MTVRTISAHISELEEYLTRLGGDAELTEDARAALSLAEFSLHLACTLVRHSVEPFPEDERHHPLIAPAFALPGLFARRIASAMEIVDGVGDKTTKQRKIVSLLKFWADMIARGELKVESLPGGWEQVTTSIVFPSAIYAGRDRFSVERLPHDPLAQEHVRARSAVEAWVSERREDLIWDQVNAFLATYGLESKTPPASERSTWSKARQHKFTHPLAKLRIKIRRK